MCGVDDKVNIYIYGWLVMELEARSKLSLEVGNCRKFARGIFFPLQKDTVTGQGRVLL